jgi:RecB family exonuclease
VHDLLADFPVTEPGAEALRLVEVFRQSALGRQLAQATRVEREFDFLYEEQGLMLRGRIDLWFEDAEGRWLVDYKTDSVTPEEAGERAREYELQMLIYAGALERLDGKRPDRALLTFLRPQTDVEVEIRDAEPLRRLIAEFQQAQERVDFPLVEGEQCGRCPHRGGACPSGRILSAPPFSSAPLP